MSNRFFCEGPLSAGDVTLEGAEAHHLTTVRRFVRGDSVTLFNGDGREYPAVVVAVGKKRAALRITGVDSPSRELAFTLHIAAALPKGDRGDFLIEKLTELGVTDFTPLATERAIVKASEGKADKLRRAVIEASKQCGRNVLMRVHPPARWHDWHVRQTGTRLIAHPVATPNIRIRHATEPITIAIGPEGGFTELEMKAAIAAGWQTIWLGSRTLRVETAAITVAAWFNGDAEPN